MKKTLITIILISLNLFSLGENNAFKNFFHHKKKIELKDTLRLSEIVVTQTDIYAVDLADTDIKRYSLEGKLLQKIGRKGQGPGEFSYPHGLTINPSIGIIIGNLNNPRVNFFSLEGSFIKSHIFEKMRSSGKIKYSQNKFYVSSLIQTRNASGDLLHIHDMSGKLEKTFFYCDFEKRYVDALLTVSLYSPFDIDRDGNIYSSYVFNYKIHQFSPDGKLLRTFPTPKNYISPYSTKIPKNVKSIKEYESWLSKWYQVFNIICSKNYVFVSLCVHGSEGYRVDVYNNKGKILDDNIFTNLVLLFSDDEGNFYFKGEETENGTIVEIYELKGVNQNERN